MCLVFCYLWGNDGNNVERKVDIVVLVVESPSHVGFAIMDGSLPGSSEYGISQTRILEWVAISFSGGIFLTQDSNPCLLHCRLSSASQVNSSWLSHQDSVLVMAHVSVKNLGMHYKIIL